MKLKKLIIPGIVLFSLVVCFAIFVVLWYWGDKYPDLDTDFDKEDSCVEIPGLGDGAVPQGIAYYSGLDLSYIDEKGEQKNAKSPEFLFISAYMKSGPSRIYVTSKKTGCVGYVTIKYSDPDNEKADEDGYVDYYGHAGGIATNCKKTSSTGTIWLASEGTLYCAQAESDTGYRNVAEELVNRARMKDGNNVIKFQKSFKTYNNASSCFYYENSNTLLVGEFYLKGNKKYQTDGSHHVTTPNGDRQHAFMHEYSVNSTTEYGLTTISGTVAEENQVPKIKAVYSITDKVQGIAITKDKQLILSQSYGLSNSKLKCYDWTKVTASSNYKTYKNLTGSGFIYNGIKNKYDRDYIDEDLKVYFIDSSTAVLKSDDQPLEYSLPSMAEGLCVNTYDDGAVRVYVLFESGSYKYKPFVRQQMNYVRSFTPRSK